MNFDYSDPYTSMSIASRGPCIVDQLKVDNVRKFTGRETNFIGDIDGAKFVNRHEKFTNKPLFQQTDVMGSTSKPLTHTRNTRDNTLHIDDIEGTRFYQKDRMQTTKRHVNPLNPDYPMPSFVPVQPETVKQVRDELFHSDIAGSHSKPLYDKPMRDTHNVHDIQAAQPNWKPRHARARREAEPHHLMKVDDISHRTRYIDKTQRVPDVMDTYHVIHGMEVYDDPNFTKPKPLHSGKLYIPDNHLLLTEDIEGARVGWKRGDIVRREYRNTNMIDDISGAHADTLKHSDIFKNRKTAMRETCPLQPVYKSLDYGDPLVPVIPPKMPPTLVTTPTLRASKSAVTTNRDSGIAFRTSNPPKPQVSNARASTAAVVPSYPPVSDAAPISHAQKQNPDFIPMFNGAPGGGFDFSNGFSFDFNSASQPQFESSSAPSFAPPNHVPAQAPAPQPDFGLNFNFDFSGASKPNNPDKLFPSVSTPQNNDFTFSAKNGFVNDIKFGPASNFSLQLPPSSSGGSGSRSGSGSGRSRPPSSSVFGANGGVGPARGQSPFNSGRKSVGGASIAERRAAQERADEINSVRML